MARHRTGHLFKRGETFYLRWTVGGKVFSRALRDEAGKLITAKREAEEARARVMAPFAVADEAAVLESIAGKLVGRRAELERLDEQNNPPLPLEEAWSAYLASTKRPDTGPDTLAVYGGQFGQFTDWMKAKHPEAALLRSVTADIAEEYAGHLNHGRLNPGTFNKHVRVLELVFRVLFQKARLTLNPWEGIQRKKLNVHSRRELTVDELRRVCQNAAGELKGLLALGIYSGLRLRDCASLRWGEVDLKRGLIRRVPSKISRAEHARPVVIPIHPTLRAILEETPEAQRAEYVLPETAATYLSGGAGKKRIIDEIQDHFVSQKIPIYKAGTGPGTDKRAIVEVGFHSLRHTFVSICRESDVPLAVVESIVGHSNPAMTRHYTHVGELAASRAVAALPAVIGKAKPQTRTDAETIRKALAIAKRMTAKNWTANRARLVALLAPAGGDGQAAKERAN